MEEEAFIQNKTFGLVPYLVEDGKKHQFALICPGGGYSVVCADHEGEAYAKKLNALGYSAFVLYYRVSENATYPNPMDDLAHGLQVILDHSAEWNLQTDSWSLWGSSAGGHLAASFGTENMGFAHYHLPAPKAMILIYPVITMGQKSEPGTKHCLIGDHPSRGLIEETSVEKQVSNRYPATYLWCGLEDTVVDPDNSRMLAEALSIRQVPFVFDTFEGIGHGVGLGEGTNAASWFSHAVAFWEAQIQALKDGGV